MAVQQGVPLAAAAQGSMVSGMVAAGSGGLVPGARTGGVPEAVAGPMRQFITFTIGAEEYGVDIMEVREIKGWTHATRLPNSPPYVRGVVNLRGLMVPVYDLRARFGMGETEITKTHVVVIVNVSGRVLGILVDAVSDILSIGLDRIQAVPELDRTVDSAFLAGLVTIEDRLVALLNLEKMFDIGKLTSDVAAAQSVAKEG